MSDINQGSEPVFSDEEIEKFLASLHDELQPDPNLGDGAYPARLITSNKEKHAWIDAHCPYPKGTYQSINWEIGFWIDQTSAISNPKRSWMAWVMRYILLPVLGLQILFQLVYLVWRLSQ